MKKNSTNITYKNIEDFRGDLTFQSSDFSFGIWDIFDYQIYQTKGNTKLVSLNKIISTKNQLLDEKFLSGFKKDPRQKAFEFMKKAALGEMEKREPIKVTKDFYIIDGNATVQVLMLLSWKDNIPIEVVS